MFIATVDKTSAQEGVDLEGLVAVGIDTQRCSVGRCRTLAVPHLLEGLPPQAAYGGIA